MSRESVSWWDYCESRTMHYPSGVIVVSKQGESKTMDYPGGVIVVSKQPLSWWVCCEYILVLFNY